jgi:hypothetical protein
MDICTAAFGTRPKGPVKAMRFRFAKVSHDIGRMAEPLLQRGHSYTASSRQPGPETLDQLMRAAAACSALLALLLRMPARQRGPMAGADGETGKAGGPAGQAGALAGYRQTKDMARDLTGDVAAIGTALALIFGRRRAGTTAAQAPKDLVR